MIDAEGRYIFLLCRLYTLKCILAFVYIPPPYDNQTLRALLEFQIKHHEVPLFVLGDFNCYTDPVLDKHPPVINSRGTKRTALKKLIDEVGWKDPWRSKYPGLKQFSCFSKSHSSLSRMDLCIC